MNDRLLESCITLPSSNNLQKSSYPTHVRLSLGEAQAEGQRRKIEMEILGKEKEIGRMDPKFKLFLIGPE